MRLLALRLAGLCLCLFAALAGAAPANETAGLVAIPALAARVTDLTATLDVGQKAGLEEKLAAFEARKGAQIVVLLLPTTQPETIEQFAIRLLDAWKIGRKGVDDGAILIVAKDDRRLRIEVGYGLEGALNDATAKRIIAEVITPRFKAGDFPGGITAGVDAIIKVVDGEALPAPEDRRQTTGGASLGEIPEALLFGLLAGIVVGGTVLRRLFGNFLGSIIAGGITGGLGWLVLGGLLGLLGGFLAGIFLSVFGLDILRSGLLSGGRGGRSGGGGFGGGGGLGGGGGASGRW